MILAFRHFSNVTILFKVLENYLYVVYLTLLIIFTYPLSFLCGSGGPTMKKVMALLVGLLVISFVLVSGCIKEPIPQSSFSTTTTSSIQSSSMMTTSLASKIWNMSLVWHFDKGGEPFMDLTPDGSMGAVVDWNDGILYLVNPDGESVSFKVWEGENVRPTISGVAIKNGVAYVLASYEGFAGVKKYSWSGFVGEERHGGPGSVADDIVRSPSGNHMCYLITTSPTTQELYCDGNKLTLSPIEHEISSISEFGIVVISIGDSSIVMKEGQKLFELNTSKAIAYRDKILASEGGKLRIYSSEGDLLAEKEGYTFGQTTLLRWTLVPTERYIFRYEPLEDTSVLTWNLTEVRVLPGFPYFANENFVVMGEDRTLHCYSLEDFHEVFSVEVPNRIGYVRLSNDGNILLVSGEAGGFWLYVRG